MRLPPGDYFNGWLGMGDDKILGGGSIQIGLHGDNVLRHGACLVLLSPLDMGGFWRSPAAHPRQNLVQYPPRGGGGGQWPEVQRWAALGFHPTVSRYSPARPTVVKSVPQAVVLMTLMAIVPSMSVPMMRCQRWRLIWQQCWLLHQYRIPRCLQWGGWGWWGLLRRYHSLWCWRRWRDCCGLLRPSRTSFKCHKWCETEHLAISHGGNSVTAWSVVPVLQVTIVPIPICRVVSPMVWFRQRTSLYHGKCLSICCQICPQY